MCVFCVKLYPLYYDKYNYILSMNPSTITFLLLGCGCSMEKTDHTSLLTSISRPWTLQYYPMMPAG